MMMSRLVALLLLLLLMAVASLAADWPQMNVYSTFEVKIIAHKWDGAMLTTYDNIDGTLLVDSVRNKIMFNGQLNVAPLGDIQATIVFDLTEGYALS